MERDVKYYFSKKEKKVSGHSKKSKSIKFRRTLIASPDSHLSLDPPSQAAFAGFKYLGRNSPAEHRMQQKRIGAFHHGSLHLIRRVILPYGGSELFFLHPVA